MIAEVDGQKAIWQPQRGSQTLFVSCPIIEALFEGTRGNGKTDALLMDFAQHVGQGFGAAWRGILFRQSYPQLVDVITKTKKWFYQIFPDARYNGSDHTWTFGDGEQLLLRSIHSIDEYWNYHGHEYPWIGWEELTNWPMGDCYEKMRSCLRSSYAGNMPRKYRATCNPWGPGHGWVKERFVDPAPARKPIVDADGQARVRIHGDIEENRILLAADPDYLKQLDSITDENLKKAWRYGAWDIAAGGIFSDVWRPSRHVVEPFEVPKSWRIDRSFDWGSSKPFAVQWWAESDGTDVKLNDGSTRSYPRGTLFLIAQWYGSNGKANEGCRMLAAEVARGILQREKNMGRIVNPGPADTSIFDSQNGSCIAADMELCGVRWERAQKGPGSRVNGWEKLRQMLAAAKPHPMEGPGLFIFSTCRDWLRTVPVLTRDESKPDDIDTDAEDHDADACRYRITRVFRRAGEVDLL